MSSDAEVSKIILQSDARTFIPSYPKSLMELMGKSSILVINGSLQRRIHGLIGSFFKSSTLKSQITAEMERYVMESMGRWREDSPIYIQDEAKNVSHLKNTTYFFKVFILVVEHINLNSLKITHTHVCVC